MPRISYFYGIRIDMYYREHVPPHFHAYYAEHEAEYNIQAGTRHIGTMPRRAEALVLEWIMMHQAELMANWNRARQQLPLFPIDPLP